MHVDRTHFLNEEEPSDTYMVYEPTGILSEVLWEIECVSVLDSISLGILGSLSLLSGFTRASVF